MQVAIQSESNKVLTFVHALPVLIGGLARPAVVTAGHATIIVGHAFLVRVGVAILSTLLASALALAHDNAVLDLKLSIFEYMVSFVEVSNLQGSYPNICSAW